MDAHQKKIIYCTYCKRENHYVNSCRFKKRNEQARRISIQDQITQLHEKINHLTDLLVKLYESQKKSTIVVNAIGKKDDEESDKEEFFEIESESESELLEKPKSPVVISNAPKYVKPQTARKSQYPISFNNQQENHQKEVERLQKACKLELEKLKKRSQTGEFPLKPQSQQQVSELEKKENEMRSNEKNEIKNERKGLEKGKEENKRKENKKKSKRRLYFLRKKERKEREREKQREEQQQQKQEQLPNLTVKPSIIVTNLVNTPNRVKSVFVPSNG
jgi:hypothetical protein